MAKTLVRIYLDSGVVLDQVMTSVDEAHEYAKSVIQNGCKNPKKHITEYYPITRIIKAVVQEIKGS